MYLEIGVRRSKLWKKNVLKSSAMISSVNIELMTAVSEISVSIATDHYRP
jgi:hypothetical protein